MTDTDVMDELQALLRQWRTASAELRAESEKHEELVRSEEAFMCSVEADRLDKCAAELEAVMRRCNAEI